MAQAVEALRKATFGQEKAQLEELCAEAAEPMVIQDGRVETKAQFIDGVMTRKAILKALTLSDHTIAIVGAECRSHATSGRPTARLDGKATSTRIGVLQVWLKQGGTWKLLARQAARLPQPASVAARAGSRGAGWRSFGPSRALVRHRRLGGRRHERSP